MLRRGLDDYAPTIENERETPDFTPTVKPSFQYTVIAVAGQHHIARLDGINALAAIERCNGRVACEAVVIHIDRFIEPFAFFILTVGVVFQFAPDLLFTVSDAFVMLFVVSDSISSQDFLDFSLVSLVTDAISLM